MLRRLDANSDSALSRAEFVDEICHLAASEGPESADTMLQQTYALVARILRKRELEVAKAEHAAADSLRVAELAAAQELSARNLAVAEGAFRTALEEAFRMLDADGDGQLSPAELQAAGLLESRLAAVMAQLDADRSGELDRREFVDALAARVTSEGGGARDETLRAVLELVARVLRARHEALLSGQQRAAADRLEAEMVSKMSEAEMLAAAQFKAMLSAAFDALDSDGSGALDAAEIIAAGGSSGISEHLLARLDLGANEALEVARLSVELESDLRRSSEAEESALRRVSRAMRGAKVPGGSGAGTHQASAMPTTPEPRVGKGREPGQSYALVPAGDPLSA